MLRDDGKAERALFLVDTEGVIRYIDVHDFDDQPANEVVFGELRKLASPGAERPAAAPEPALPTGGIVMYCSQWCPDCRRAKLWLKARGLEFTEVDVYAAPGASEQVRKWAGGHLVTPTFDVDGTIVVDFDEEGLKAALGLAG